MLNDFFTKPIKAVNLGVPAFKEDMEKQGASAVGIEWKPPAGGNEKLIAALDSIDIDRKNEANQKAVAIIKEAHPILVDVDYAINVLPGMTKHTILHAGPPITFENMCGAMKGAVIGALIFEGLAEDSASALALLETGVISFAPCHHFGAVGPMAGIISPSMPVHVVQDKAHGNNAYATINEGLGKVLRFGANSPEVINRLKFIEKEFAPALKEVIRKSGGIDLRSLTAQALQMGDECHNRNKASTSLFLRDLIGLFMESGLEKDVITKAMAFIAKNEHYYLNLSMAACKCSLDAAYGIPYSTIVTAMARNGVEFGIRVSGLEGWFTGPAQMVQGLLFAGYTEDDANPDLGDSAITETFGIGGFAMGAAPAIVQFVGGQVQDAIGYTRKMYEITESENPIFSLPPLDFRGAATGIDITKVVEKGILPIINTGIAHKEPGVGQVGAGIVSPPAECFEKALITFQEKYKNK